jgi:hypothetical protein
MSHDFVMRDAFAACHFFFGLPDVSDDLDLVDQGLVRFT